MNTLKQPLPEHKGDFSPNSLAGSQKLLETAVLAKGIAADAAIDMQKVSYWRGTSPQFRKTSPPHIAVNLLKYGRSKNDVLDDLLEFGSMFLNVPSLMRGELHGHKLQRILDNITVQIPRGSVVCVADIGGMSRTSLMRIVAKMVPPKSGEVIRNGRVVSLEQADAIPMPYRTIRHNLLSLGRLLGLQREEILRVLPAMQKWIGKPDVLQMPVKRVSKLLKFDVSLSLICSGLFDVIVVEEIRKIVSEPWLQFVKEAPRRGYTFLLSSSKIQDALELSTHALLLDQGRLLDFGLTEDMTRRHRAFIEAASRASTVVSEQSAMDEDQDDELM